MPGIVKIGRTNHDPFTRAQSLRTTGVPTPFVVEFCLWTPDSAALETYLHRKFAPHRVERAREFFRLDIHEIALAAVAQRYTDDDQASARLLDDMAVDQVPQELAVSWDAFHSALQLVLDPPTQNCPWPVTHASALAQGIREGDSTALTTVLAAINSKHQEAAALLVSQVLTESLCVEPEDWPQLLLLKGGPAVSWVIEVAPALGPTFAEMALSLFRGIAQKSHGYGNLEWILRCADLLWTGDLDPVEALGHFHSAPSLVTELCEVVADELASPWRWRSLHVPSPQHLRRLCVWRDLLTLLRPAVSSKWPITVRDWPRHIWPPNPYPDLAQSTLNDTKHVVAYWKEMLFEDEKH